MAGARNGPKAIILNQITPASIVYSYTCADNNALSRGTIVELRDPYTASMANAWTSGTSASSGAALGVVLWDKEALDGSTQVSVLKEGRVDVRSSGAATAGFPAYCAGNDEVYAAPATLNAGVSGAVSIGLFNSMMFGIYEETATDGEVVVVRFSK